MVQFDPAVWGPHYWFTIHTIAFTYPEHPNAITKKKYYDFFMNLPIFLPAEPVSSEFEKLLDAYPVSSYLDTRNHLIRWTHFIHNAINRKLEKPQMTYDDFYATYNDAYKPKKVKVDEWRMVRRQIAGMALLFGLVGISVYLYMK